MNPYIYFNTLLYILSLVAANLLTSILSGNLDHIALYHDLLQFFERGGVRIPVELCLCLGRIAPEFDYIYLLAYQGFVP